MGAERESNRRRAYAFRDERAFTFRRTEAEQRLSIGFVLHLLFDFVRTASPKTAEREEGA